MTRESGNRVTPRWLPLIAAVLLTLLVSACTSGGQADFSDSPAPGTLNFGNLPPLPMDDQGLRSTAAINTTIQNGADAVAMSPGASVSGSSLSITAGPGLLEYGMYQFDPAGATLTSVLAALSVDAGVNSWIAIANYGTMSWDFAGPFPASGATQFDNLGSGNYLSPGQSCFFLVIAFDSSTVNVATVEFSADTPTVVTYTTDIAPIMTQYCTGCHDAGSPAAGIPLTTYAEVSANASASLATVLNDSMPLGPTKLTADEKQKFQDWIDGGKPE